MQILPSCFPYLQAFSIKLKKTRYNSAGSAVTDSIDRLAKIVDSLLVLAANSDPGHDTDEDVMLDPLMEAIQGELSAQLDERDMSCSVICGELSVTADPALLYVNADMKL